MTQLDALRLMQYWINKQDSQAHDLAVSYIKSNSDLLDTNIDEFIKNCPEGCKLKVEEMLLKAGIEFPDTSLKKYDKLLPDYIRADKIDYQKSLDDYTSYTLNNKSNWTVMDTGPVMEGIL